MNQTGSMLSNSTMNNELNLTIDSEESIAYLNKLLEGMRVDIPSDITESPTRPSERSDESFLVLEQRGLVRLSEATRKLELERLAKLDRKRKSLRQRKAYTRKPGTVHPKKKEATRKRKLKKKWEEDPIGCLIRRAGSWKLDRELWKEHIAPLWENYYPADLTVRARGRGTAAEPYTVFSLLIEHRKHGTVFDGNSLELYLLSSVGSYESS